MCNELNSRREKRSDLKGDRSSTTAF
jgi:hypothetical protein